MHRFLVDELRQSWRRTAEPDAARAPEPGAKLRRGDVQRRPRSSQCRQREPLASYANDAKGRERSGEDVLRRHLQYEYGNARIGLFGRGWLGFGRVTTTLRDSVGKLVSETRKVRDNETLNEALRAYPFAFLDKSLDTESAPAEDGIVSTTAEATRLTAVDNTWQVGQSESGRPFVYLDQRTTNTGVRIPTGTGEPDPMHILWASAQDFAVDGYGNVTRESTVVKDRFDAVIETSGTTTTYDLRPWRVGSWLVALPWTVLRESDRDGQPHSRLFEYVHDLRGLLTHVIRSPDAPDTKVDTEIVRDDYGNATSITSTDAQGHVRGGRMFDFDSRHLFVERIRNPLFREALFSYDEGTGQVRSRMDQKGRIWQTAYDGFGRPTHQSTPTDEVEITYFHPGFDEDEFGPLKIRAELQVATVVQGKGSTDRFFDALGRLVKVRFDGYQSGAYNRVSREIEYAWDGQVRMASRLHLDLDDRLDQGFIQFIYDDRRRLRQVAYPDGANETYTYATPYTIEPGVEEWMARGDAMELGCVEDPTLAQNMTIVDHAGNVVAAIDGEYSVTEYAYAAFGQLWSVFDPAGTQTKIDYDDYGRKVWLDDPDMGTNDYSYTAFDELQTQSDTRGHVRTHQYDVLGRLVSLDSPEERRVWQHDIRPGQTIQPNDVGELLIATRTTLPADPTRPPVEINYYYEPPPVVGGAKNRGQLERVVHEIDHQDYTVSLTYDDYGRPDEIHYPSAAGEPFVVRQKYDQHDWLVAVEDASTLPPPGTAPTQYWAFEQAYHAYRVKHERLGNGVETEYSYNAARGWTEGISSSLAPGPAAYSVTMGYNPDGTLSARNETGGIVPHERFYYNNYLKRLSQVKDGDTGTELYGYVYDAMGSITHSPLGIYHYPGPGEIHPHAVQDVGDNHFDYDAAGNQTSRVGPDIPGGQQTIAYSLFNLPLSLTTGTGPAAQTVTYDYDTNQHRVLKRTPTETTTYVGDLYERVDSALGSIEHRYYVHARGRRIAQVKRTEQSGAITNEQTHYFLADHLGSVRVITDESGTVTSEQHFTPFGEPIEVPQPDPLTHYGFTGHEHDAESGLINMRGRMYDPKLGRFLSPDPVVQAPFWSQSLNRYSYAYNSPVNLVDPSGFSPCMGQGCGEADRGTYSGGGGAHGGGSPPTMSGPPGIPAPGPMSPGQSSCDFGMCGFAASGHTVTPTMGFPDVPDMPSVSPGPSENARAAAAPPPSGPSSTQGGGQTGPGSAGSAPAPSGPQAQPTPPPSSSPPAPGGNGGPAGGGGPQGGPSGNPRPPGKVGSPHGPPPQAPAPMIGPSDIPYIPLDPGIRLPNVPQQIPSPDTWSIVTIEGGWDVGMQAGAGEMEGTIVDVNTGETFKYKSGGANVGPYMGLDVGLRGVGLVAGDPRTFGTYTPVSLSLAVVTFTVYLNGAAPMGGSISSSFGTGQVGLSVGIGGSYKLAPTP